MRLGEISKWLRRSESPFLKSYTKKKNRSIVFSFVQDTTPNGDWNLPYGTWAFVMRNVANGDVDITLGNGVLFTIESGDSLEFPGETYLERNDVISKIDIKNNNGILEIICHRVVEDNT